MVEYGHSEDKVDVTRANNGRRHRAESKEELEWKTPEELEELRRISIDENGSYRMGRWLEGKYDLDDEEIQKLVPKLPDIFYDRRRKDIAEKFGIRLQTLDRLRNGSVAVSTTSQGKEVVLESPDPWPEPVDIGTLLDDLAGMFRRYVVLPDGGAEILALWTAFTYVGDSFQISPVLCITSPQKRCGKTTLLSVLGALVNRALPTISFTSAVLFRVLEQVSQTPTILIDEADTFFGDKDELRGMLNAGHFRSQAYVLRCVRPDFEPRSFRVWCPKAIALIGRLTGKWTTLADRSIEIRLQRKRGDEGVQRLRLDRLQAEAEELRRKLVRWAADFAHVIAELEPPEFPFLNDRAADNWRSLLAIAKAASNPFAVRTWLDRARESVRLLSGADEEDDDLRSQLLADLWTIFQEHGEDRLSSAEIVTALHDMYERPWPEYRDGKPISQTQLASLLRPFGVRAKQFKRGGSKLRGYFLSHLEPVVKRYCDSKTINSLPNKEMPGTTRRTGTGSEVVPQSNSMMKGTGSEMVPVPGQGDAEEPIFTQHKEIEEQVPLVPHLSEGMAQLDIRLARDGWIAWRAEALDGEIVLVSKDPSKIPEKYSSKVVYTPKELSRLLGCSDAQLRRVHQLKRTYGGEVQ